MNELGRRIKAVLETRRMSARELSIAAELNTEEVSRILESPTRIPRLDTLWKLCAVGGWRLEDAAYWALNRQPPAAPAGEPEQIIAEQLARMGYTESRRKIILDWILEMRPALPNTE